MQWLFRRAIGRATGATLRTGLQDFNSSDIQEKINEFYTYGDFVNPLMVKKTSKGYILSDSYEQFEAALELGVTECLCKVV